MLRSILESLVVSVVSLTLAVIAGWWGLEKGNVFILSMSALIFGMATVQFIAPWWTGQYRLSEFTPWTVRLVMSSVWLPLLAAAIGLTAQLGGSGVIEAYATDAFWVTTISVIVFSMIMLLEIAVTCLIID